MALEPGLYIVTTIVEHVYDYILSKVLKLSKYRLAIFLVKDHHLESLQIYGNQAIPGQIKKHVCKHVLAILTTYMETKNIRLAGLRQFNTIQHVLSKC